jgi:hypothetical protein
MQEPTNRKPGSSEISTVLKVLGGLAAFFALLCMGFVFFVAVVCGR